MDFWTDLYARSKCSYFKSLRLVEFSDQLITDPPVKKYLYSDCKCRNSVNKYCSTSLPNLKCSVNVKFPAGEYWAFSADCFNNRIFMPCNAIFIRSKAFTSLPNIYLNDQFDVGETKVKKYLEGSVLKLSQILTRTFLENWVLIRLGNSICELSLVNMLINRLHMERCAASENELLLCELQKSYEKLLIKYAEAENTIDRMKLGYVQSFEPLEHDASLPKLRAIGYIHDCNIGGIQYKNDCCRIKSGVCKANTALVTGNKLGPNSSTPLDLFPDEEILSSIDTLSASYNQESVIPTDRTFKSLEREIGSSKCSNGNHLNGENGEIFKTNGHQNDLLLNDEEDNARIQLPVLSYSRENILTQYHPKSIEITSPDIHHLEGEVHLKNSNNENFILGYGTSKPDNFQSMKTNSFESYCPADGQNVVSSDLHFESTHGKEKTSLPAQSHHNRKLPSTYNYALVWPIQFANNGDTSLAGGSTLETCSEPSVDFSWNSSLSVSSLEGTHSGTQAEEVPANATPVSSCNGIEASPVEAVSAAPVQSFINVKGNSKTHVYVELLRSIERADNLASKMKRKSENLKSFLVSQLDNLS